MANMQDYRAQLMAGGLKVSYTDLLVKFVAKALTEFSSAQLQHRRRRDHIQALYQYGRCRGTG